jgi:glutamate-1-semialdehyde 2,1-aminomutase
MDASRTAHERTRAARRLRDLIAVYEEWLATQLARSHALAARASARLPGGVSSAGKSWYPLYLREGRGAHLVDIDGNEYVDLIGGFGPNLLGHAPEAVLSAAAEAAGRGTVLAVATELEVELAETIASLVPSMEQMRFVTSGTEATMLALRVARAYTGRTKVAKFEGHYHGQHDAVLVSAVGREMAGPAQAPVAVRDCAGLGGQVESDTVVLPWNNTDAMVALLRAHAGELAAVICEPVPFFLIGGNPPNAGLLETLRQVTEEEQILLIFDEVVTGFRLEPGGAAAHFGVVPDLHTFGKLVGGGFPIGVYGGRAELMGTVLDGPGAARIYQSGTFSGSPVSMAAGIAMLNRLADGAPQAIAAARAEALRDGWRASIAASGLAAQVTGMASWLGFYFVDAPVRDRRDVLANDLERARAFSLGLLSQGVYLPPGRPGFTSAVHSDGDIEVVLAASGRVIAEIADAA